MIDIMNKCSKFEDCNAPICPLDIDADKRIRLKGEVRCPYTMNSKTKVEKGTRTGAKDSLLLVIPIRNLKMLNTKNYNRYMEIKRLK